MRAPGPASAILTRLALAALAASILRPLPALAGGQHLIGQVWSAQPEMPGLESVEIEFEGLQDSAGGILIEGVFRARRAASAGGGEVLWRWRSPVDRDPMTMILKDPRATLLLHRCTVHEVVCKRVELVLDGTTFAADSVAFRLLRSDD